MTELNVIAAAVIGGTSLAGGIGTIYGAVLGAVVMQSLESGMVLMGVPSPMQKMVLAVVLILRRLARHGLAPAATGHERAAGRDAGHLQDLRRRARGRGHEPRLCSMAR